MNDTDPDNARGGSPRDRDEQLLIDFVLGQCDEPTVEQVRARLAADAEFSALHVDVANSFGALGTFAAPDPPDDLEERTLQRVRALRRTEMLLEAQPMGVDERRPVFSFREMMTLAAAAVVAIAIVLPSFRRAQQLSRRSLCQDNVGQIGAALGHYASANNDRLPATPAPNEWWGGDRARASNSAGLYQLVRHRLAAPEMFQCASTGERAFVVKAGEIDFPSPKTISYSYQHTINSSLKLGQLRAKHAILADDSPIFENGRFVPDRLDRPVSTNHGGDGQNVLYPSGAVVWVTHSLVGVDGDNIFLAGAVRNYVGRERPASDTDSFLLPHSGR